MDEFPIDYFLTKNISKKKDIIIKDQQDWVLLQLLTFRDKNSNQDVNVSFKFLIQQIVSELIGLGLAEQINAQF